MIIHTDFIYHAFNETLKEIGFIDLENHGHASNVSGCDLQTVIKVFEKHLNEQLLTILDPETPKAVYNIANALWQVYSHSEFKDAADAFAGIQDSPTGTDDPRLIELATNILRRYEDFS